MKYEWKKHEKELYNIKSIPSIIVVPKQKFLMISGKGNPNKPDFAERVGVLNSLAWPIKMRHKAFCSKNLLEKQFQYEDYTVFPLEGVWASAANNPLDKDSFEYTIMMRQPDFITQEMFIAAYSAVEKKKPHPLLGEVVFDSMEDGLCVQMLHIGSFDTEPESFEKMQLFIKDNGFERIDHIHREIYLTDARKIEPAKYRTILRYRIKNSMIDI